MINGTSIGTPTYDCAYSVGRAGITDVVCDRVDGHGSSTEVKFVLVLTADGRVLGFHAVPGEPPFDVVSVAGVARQQ